MKATGTELERARREWDALAREDAMWAVLTDPARHGHRWTEQEFLDSGREEVAAMLAMLDTIGHPAPQGEAIDFGCGAGRLSQALAERFEHVVGIDAAAGMIDVARRMNHQGDRCEFRLNTSQRLEHLEDGRFALGYTCRVLQHIPPAYAHGYVGELLRVVRPDGVLVFQIPSQPARTLPALAIRLLPEAAVNKLRRVAQGASATMEMHGTPPRDVIRLVQAHGGDVVHVQADTSAGPNWRSFTYVARKRR